MTFAMRCVWNAVKMFHTKTAWLHCCTEKENIMHSFFLLQLQLAVTTEADAACNVSFFARRNFNQQVQAFLQDASLREAQNNNNNNMEKKKKKKMIL